MTVTRGASHVFLGMDIRFSKACTVKIKMTEYIKEAITDFGENISRSVATPAKKDLFEIDETSGELTMKDKETVHSVVAKSSSYTSLKEPGSISNCPSHFFARELPAAQNRTG